MHRFAFVATLTLLSIALAGCSGGSDDPAAAPAPSSSTTSTGPAPKPVPVTDTLHMLAAPEMTADASRLGSEERSPVTAGGFGGGQQAEGASWQYFVQAPTNITGGEVHIWIEIKETMVPNAFDRESQTCTWALHLEVGADSPFDMCLAEPAGPISAGTKELVFRLDVVDPVNMEAGETISVVLTRKAFSASPNNAVDALSGSSSHDSFVQLRGLVEPVKDA